ncbi:MAG TPA: hypothetical protein VEK07_13335 [Polyangiaceae bacterium]|nr:hypothetical protein [Polyangiaceae bacterium]
MVIGSTVQFVGDTLTAGRGVDGTPGAAGEATPNYAAPQAPAGTSPSLNGAGLEEPGVGGNQTCANQDSSAGGNGGDQENSLGPPAPTNGTAVPLPPPVTDAGAPPEDGLAGGTTLEMGPSGDPGATGEPRPAGTMATTLGALTSTPSSATWEPTTGGGGGTGGPGQGGGGGNGLDSQGRASPAGGGGAGGCGGTGGGGGAGGGASVAALAIESSISLTGCTVITGGGGTGGEGGTGQDGEVGGLGGGGGSGGGTGAEAVEMAPEAREAQAAPAASPPLRRRRLSGIGASHGPELDLHRQ